MICLDKLIELCNELNCQYAENEPMSKHTTFKIGGKARLVVYPENEEQVSRFIKTAKDENIRIITIGNGSNLLVDDDGVDACVMILGENMAKIELLGDDVIYAQSGALLIKVCRFAYEHGLTGLEFAYGIPGSCGGAAFMNAGAYGGEMKDILYRCDHIDADANKGKLENEEIKSGYRCSAYCDNGCVITAVYLKMKKGDKAQIKAKMDDLMARRKEKQPIEYPSAGSTFKRPPGKFAGALIQGCNLKGRRYGGAQVSEKHAGFIINKGNATCRDVLELCKICTDTVFEKTGVELEKEIRIIR